MKLLFFTDTHIRGTTPRNRKDNLIETLETKFKEILYISKEHDVDFILHGGDLFDRPDISPSIVRKFALILNSFHIPIYAIAGNHDIYGHNIDTLHRTMLGLFDAIGIIKLIKQDEVVFLSRDNIKVQLTGQSYKYNIDSKTNKNSYIINKKDDDVDYAIHIVHGMLLDKPFIEGIPYTLIDDILDTKADITLSGHYHSGFGVKEIEGKYFINPGSVIRITNSLREIDRTPKVVLIKLDKDINIDLIPLKTAKPGKEILDRSHIEMAMLKNERIVEFKQSIDSSADFEKLDIDHIVNSLAQTEGVSDSVKKEALMRIGNAQMYYEEDEDE
ncbi:metallophosphoesterase family protein [Thermohalobacter berrensis]|uniref:Metallophosphoesterase n=1 Tax=Thermohalobacter berrensis TaxID=99594 RepID=A0A419TAM5_9FIRM|nr:metallophosphoesterase [Thermohalobacter berrensis]RKD34497.1 metallophosphoesterase [Thermohalobacter berrensis]